MFLNSIKYLEKVWKCGKESSTGSFQVLSFLFLFLLKLFTDLEHYCFNTFQAMEKTLYFVICFVEHEIMYVYSLLFSVFTPVVVFPLLALSQCFLN